MRSFAMGRATALMLALALCLGGGLAATAHAHDYWVMPQSFTPAPGSVVDAAFVCGHDYFKAEGIPDITKFRAFMVTPSGRELALAYQRAGRDQAWLAAPIAAPGTYILGAAAAQPEFWSKTPSGYQPKTKAELKEVIETGMYLKSVKTFLTAGQPTGGFGQVLGHVIELVPQSNPTTLKPGGELAVTVLFKGAPLAGAPVFAVYQGFKPEKHGDAAASATTNAQGTAKIKVDRPGVWMVWAKHEVETPGAPLADKANYRPYMMFSVSQP